MRIHKYVLKVTDHQTVKMPPLSHVLKVARHQGEMFAWAVVNEGVEATEDVDFWIVGTGHRMPGMKADALYIDTVFDGSLVWHVFSGPCYD